MCVILESFGSPLWKLYHINIFLIYIIERHSRHIDHLSDSTQLKKEYVNQTGNHHFIVGLHAGKVHKHEVWLLWWRFVLLLFLVHFRPVSYTHLTLPTKLEV